MDGKVVSVFDNKGNLVSIPENPDVSYNENAFYAELFTIDGRFCYAKKALLNADDVNIDYDKDIGFPNLISIDWNKQELDDEIGITVSTFETLP